MSQLINFGDNPNAAGYYSLTPYIVGTDIHSQFSTISAAIAAAVAAGASPLNPAAVLVKPGIYIENLVLSPGVDIMSFFSTGFSPTVTIKGKITHNTAGRCSIGGVRLETNGDFCVSVSGSVASVLNINGCFINCSNNTGISFTSSSSSAEIYLSYCVGELQTTGVALFSSSSAGNLFLTHSDFYNPGGSSTASSASAGTVGLRKCGIEHPISTSGTAQLTAVAFQMYTTPLNATCMTLGGSGDHTFFELSLESGTATACVINNTTTMSHAIISSSNAQTVNGSGTWRYAYISFAGASSGHAVTTETAIPTL